MIAVSATACHSIEALFARPKRSPLPSQAGDFPERDSAPVPELFFPFVIEPGQEKEVTPADVTHRTYEPFFDVIMALEHEASRLELNLLAAILERALDACLAEKRRIERHQPPFQERVEPSGSQGTFADLGGSKMKFRSARPTQ